MGKTSLIGTLSVLFFLIGCGRINQNLGNDPQYSIMIGKEYKTKQELILYSRQWSKKIIIDRIGASGVPEKEELKSEFPQKWKSKTIYGLLPIGSKFKIIRVMRQGSRSVYWTYYYAKITQSEESKFFDWEVCILGLTDVTVEPPTFKPDYVEELPASQE